MPPDESKGSQLDAIGSLDRRQLDNTVRKPSEIAELHVVGISLVICSLDMSTISATSAPNTNRLKSSAISAPMISSVKECINTSS